MKKKANKTPLELVVDSMKDRYSPFVGYGGGAKYDYDTYHACQNGSDCCDHDYCRCGVIQNARVTSVNIDLIIKHMTKDLDDLLMSYCVDRVMRASKVMDVGNWEVNVSGGYYGQEVHGVTLEDRVLKEVIGQLTELAALSEADQIKKLLEYEYGYVLPRLKSLDTVTIRHHVSLDKIKLFNDEYLRKVSKETVDYYKDYELPRGICVKSGNMYSVVDGYHRMLSAQKHGQEAVSIIELSE